MSYLQPQTIIVQQTPGTSGLAIAGLIFSILGWFTCGLLCIPGAFFCLLALFSRGPKGAAIAGLIVGFPGTLFFAFVGLGIIMSVLGIGAAATSGIKEGLDRAAAESQTQVEQQAPDAVQTTENAIAESSARTPSEDEERRRAEEEGRRLREAEQMRRAAEEEMRRVPEEIQTEAQRRYRAAEQSFLKAARIQAGEPTNLGFREWTDDTGTHKTKAKLKAVVGGKAVLKPDSNVTTIQVPLESLSKEDVAYIARFSSPAPSEYRTWTDNCEQPVTTAQFVGVVWESVVLETESDNKTVTVLLTRLSKEDQEYVTQHKICSEALSALEDESWQEYLRRRRELRGP